ncbi:MAG: Shedu immune nuclease family protein [Methylocystis sp.]|uniref:Shedu immune nuclease family protein n=1 Tax=Methylocystis sp. TaxID=1911079 RepID=UPI003D1016D6
MSDDANFIANYKNNHLYVHPGKTGAYAAIAGESEQVIGEIDVTQRCKLAVSAFYVNDHKDFGTFKITKLQFHARYGWRESGHIQVNKFQLAQIREFLSIISSLDLSDAQKTRVSLDNIHVGALGALLSSTKGADLIGQLASTPELHQDIYAVAAKRAALDEFKENLDRESTSEPDWQAFFERNPWIFGHGLNYVFLDKVSKKLEARTTGSSFDRPGKRADGLMLTRAEVSQYVLVEIKKNSTELLQKTIYRPGCWSVSDEVSGAVTQTQKTVFEFSRQRFRDDLKDEIGNSTGTIVYTIEPRSFLVVGSLAQLEGNDDKIACFELYRKNIRSPEILTFDELFYRANCIVENISRVVSRPDKGSA